MAEAHGMIRHVAVLLFHMLWHDGLIFLICQDDDEDDSPEAPPSPDAQRVQVRMAAWRFCELGRAGLPTMCKD